MYGRQSNAADEGTCPWDVLLIGGASATGKTSVSYRLARQFQAGITEVDDLHIVLERLTTPEQQPALHYWRTNPAAALLAPEAILELHVAVSRLLAPAIEAVIVNHVQTQTPIVLEGDYVLPEIVAGDQAAQLWNAHRLRAVFLYEPDEAQIVQNLSAREPAEGRQERRAHVSWLYGQFLQHECRRYGVPALAARPWDTLFERIVGAIE